MRKLVRPFVFSSMFVAALFLLLAVQMPTAQASGSTAAMQLVRPLTIEDTTAVTGMIPISGTSLQMLQMETQVFSQTSPTTISGDSYPAFLICPGFPATTTAPTSFFISFQCGPTTSNGFRGWFEAQEHVIRDYSNPLTPTFTFSATQVFAGNMWLEGKPYFGSLTQYMELTGTLNADPSCPSAPANPICGATGFQGVWTIVEGEGTGQLRHLRGSGTLVWGGIPFPPFYEGAVYSRTSRMCRPLRISNSVPGQGSGSWWRSGWIITSTSW